MSKQNQTEAEQAQNQQNPVQRLLKGTAWDEYGKLAVGVVIGLALNGLIMTFVTGGELTGLLDGVAFMAPGAFLGAAVHHRYDPLDMAYISPAILFLAIGVANTITLLVKAFRSGAQTSPGLTVAVLAVVALMFTPGPFLGSYAVRRWWL